MIKTNHRIADGGIKVLNIDYQTWNQPEASDRRSGISVSHHVYSSGSWTLDFQFQNIEGLQELVNEMRALLDEWMTEELAASVGNSVG